jgi:hypothetical protein
MKVSRRLAIEFVTASAYELLKGYRVGCHRPVPQGDEMQKAPCEEALCGMNELLRLGIPR